MRQLLKIMIRGMLRVGMTLITLAIYIGVIMGIIEACILWGWYAGTPMLVVGFLLLSFIFGIGD